MSPGFLKDMDFSVHQAIKEVVDAFDIPVDLVMNIDQTPLPFILLSKYTVDKKNEKLVQNLWKTTSLTKKMGSS